MNKNQKPSMSKRRATVAAVLCFVAAIAIAGTYTFNDYRKTQKNELAKAEEKAKQDSEAAKETGTSKIKNEDMTSDTDESDSNGTGKDGTTTGSGTTDSGTIDSGTTGTSGSKETGTTVNVDIGNGYELLYGQLKEVPVKVGDYVEAKSVLGYVSQPTKYYSKEGCNVYFEMRKDGQPVNPVEYTADQD